MVGAAAMSMRQASIQNSAITDYFQSEINFVAQVITDPSKTSTDNYSFTARLLNFEADGQRFNLRTPVRVISKGDLHLLPGQQITADATVIKTKEARVAALLIVNEEISILTQPSAWASGLGSIRQNVPKQT